ncbi:MAG TPA: cysteine--tRNA ligase [Candidatus Gastranaerophilaceae bacterium]|nr:cysteine--tRNA ligase [Candidatus Gastranaerophilaceae bacterium]
MKLYNTYSQKTEEFISIEANKVKMYVCGPTVYDLAHLGHARCYITWDVLYRYLKFKGYEVTYCRNVTDVDDKILNKAQKEGKTPDEISQHYYKLFSESMKKLNTLPPDIEPFATKTLGEMIAMNKQLIEKGFAYESNGDVYFRVKKFDKYGALSKQPLDALEAGARVETSEIKENPMDFALWKKDEKFGYKSPWGTGRPGWHIECSAMSRKYLGETIDIHAGGADLIFPHHENEIAQSECANGCQFVKYWLHNGFVTINKEKMSKSLGNFLTIDGILEKYDANTIRFFILTNHYRMPVEFSDEALESAQAGVKRLYNAINQSRKTVKIDENLNMEAFDEYKQFVEAMDEDLNTSKALAVLFDLANKLNKVPNPQNLALLINLSEALGFNFDKVEISQDELKEKINLISSNLGKTFADMEEILQYRKSAREEKNWDLADKIRLAFDEAGIVLKDSKDGTTWELK